MQEAKEGNVLTTNTTTIAFLFLLRVKKATTSSQLVVAPQTHKEIMNTQLHNFFAIQIMFITKL